MLNSKAETTTIVQLCTADVIPDLDAVKVTVKVPEADGVPKISPPDTESQEAPDIDRVHPV
ncbi:MAG: hypothetical protein LBJ20_07715, partial [Candidatus Methanoplasma sp.]|nr:hypothetical protein [Candidatus Methanoplasma sp.]